MIAQEQQADLPVVWDYILQLQTHALILYAIRAKTYARCISLYISNSLEKTDNSTISELKFPKIS